MIQKFLSQPIDKQNLTGQSLNSFLKTWVELFTDPHTSVEYSA